jgi:hypothetical protein
VESFVPRSQCPCNAEAEGSRLELLTQSNMVSLENYTFLTSEFATQSIAVYAGVQGQSLKGFSNMQKIIEFQPN